MSEAPNAPEAVVAPVTLLTGESAPAPAGDTSSPASGEGEGAAAPGQGAAGEAPHGGAPAEGGEPPADKGGDTQGAPEQYAAFEVPDGYTLEGDWLDQVQTYAKAQNMTQAQAQDLVTLGVQQAERLLGEFAQANTETPVLAAAHWAKVWTEQTTADTEIGGQKLQGTLALASRVFQTFGSPELTAFMNQTGIGNHPELVRFMAKVGQAISEDVLVTPQGGQAKRGGDIAKRMYPSLN